MKQRRGFLSATGVWLLMGLMEQAVQGDELPPTPSRPKSPTKETPLDVEIVPSRSQREVFGQYSNSLKEVDWNRSSKIELAPQLPVLEDEYPELEMDSKKQIEHQGRSPSSPELSSAPLSPTAQLSAEDYIKSIDSAGSLDKKARQQSSSVFDKLGPLSLSGFPIQLRMNTELEFDSNAFQYGDRSVLPSDISDTRWNQSLGVQSRWATRPIFFGYQFLNSQYSSLHQLDLQSQTLNVIPMVNQGKNKWLFPLVYSHFELGGTPTMDRLSLSTRWLHPLQGLQDHFSMMGEVVSSNYKPSHLKGFEGYDYRLQTGYRDFHSEALTLDYELSATTTQFEDGSQEFNEWVFKTCPKGRVFFWPLLKYQSELGLSFRYDSDGGRQDRRYLSSLRGFYEGRFWTAGSRVAYDNNHSNRSAFSYDKVVFSLDLELRL